MIYYHGSGTYKFCPRGNKLIVVLAAFGIIPSIYQEGMRSNFPEYCEKQQAIIFCMYLQASFC